MNEFNKESLQKNMDRYQLDGVLYTFFDSIPDFLIDNFVENYKKIHNDAWRYEVKYHYGGLFFPVNMNIEIFTNSESYQLTVCYGEFTDLQKREIIPNLEMTVFVIGLFQGAVYKKAYKDMYSITPEQFENDIREAVDAIQFEEL